MCKVVFFHNIPCARTGHPEPYMGGWSVRSAAVHDYIDASCPATPAAERFFGWLARR